MYLEDYRDAVLHLHKPAQLVSLFEQIECLPYLHAHAAQTTAHSFKSSAI